MYVMCRKNATSVMITIIIFIFPIDPVSAADRKYVMSLPTQCSWVTITNRKKVEQNQAYPVIALYMDINWAKFQNPTHSLFWENAIWSCVVKSLHGELRFTIFGHFATFHPLNQARAEFDINRTWSLWRNLSFATKKLKIGWLS